MVQGTVRKWWLVPAVFLALLPFAACQKRAEKAPTPIAANATVAQPAPTTQSAAAAPAPPAPKTQSAAAPSRQTTADVTPGASIVLTKESAGASPPGATRGFTSPAGLMALGRDKRFLPEDFKIGPLGDARGEDSQSDAAIATGDGFLARLVAGSIETGSLATDAQATLSDTLAYALERGYKPHSYRMGAVVTDASGQMIAPVRLWGTVGTAEGAMYFERAGAVWLVADLQVSLAQLAVARTAPKEKFFPSAYRWLLED